MRSAVNTYRIGKFDLNPRGQLWVKDENKFGQKLLSKMGWSQGKGLGKNENGITDSIKVRMKIGNSGVGFSEKLPLGLESSEYNAVLESLNNKFKATAETTTDNIGDGLEQRSQKFKKRLHYQKFVRGKDVGRYSEKDMNSIFVTRKTPVEPAIVPVKSTVTNVDCDPAVDDAPESVPTFKSKMSMNDYFAMKFKKKSVQLPVTSLLCSGDTIEKESSLEKVSNKKRKREAKNNSKKSKKIKIEQDEITDNIEALPEVAISEEIKMEKESAEDFPPLNESPIKKENKKSKIGEKIQNLKSCLKNKITTNLWFNQDKKEVSFNDSVSYKIIENVLNKDDEETFFMCDETDLQNPIDCFEEDLNAYEEKCTIDEDNDIVRELIEIYSGANITNNSKLEEGEIEGQQIDEERPVCFDLPKCDNSNYNTWLESQRIAIKMKVYKNMVKKFRKNPVLRTCNLLDIKGYGNWGI